MSETISFAALRSLNSQFQLLRDILYIRKTQNHILKMLSVKWKVLHTLTKLLVSKSKSFEYKPGVLNKFQNKLN